MLKPILDVLHIVFNLPLEVAKSIL